MTIAFEKMPFDKRYKNCDNIIMKLPSTFTEEKGCINVLVETPAGSAAKYNFDDETGLFKLKKILPAGLVFPFHFGFVPHTHAQDGDPLDVLVIMDGESWPGCVIECKVLGVIEAEQTTNDITVRNDRIIASALASKGHEKINSIFDFDSFFVDEIINFLVSYTRLEEKKFKVIAKHGPQTAIDLIRKQVANFKS